ncbi:hypothetical protein BDP27DRAFT_1446367 [Rhodocollybia butyracea]|uniref:Uncharacterized protein n=1 Tax=Rhodocollybia butyracea TaxID=206335 RepID=A0A9P5U9Z2_9AGAR|nr:hypothetical protein BDP27DRAFT_1446367 [Rhodocollybia butyracea]
MFFAHHSLGFVLLALLISPACAMPLGNPHTYFVQVLDERGDKVQLTTNAAKEQVRTSISILAKKNEDGQVEPEHIQLIAEGYNLKELDPSSMIFYKLTGHNFCTKMKRSYGYGYAITPTKDRSLAFGGVVADAKDFDFGGVVSNTDLLSDEQFEEHVGHAYEVYYILPDVPNHRAQEVMAHLGDAYYEFLTRFAPVKGWVVVMGQIKEPHPSSILKKAYDFFRRHMDYKVTMA